MTLEHYRHLDPRPQSASHGPRIPSLEEAIDARRLDMPPEPLVGMIGEAAGAAALGVEHAGTDVRKVHLDSPILSLEVNKLRPPSVIEAEQTRTMRLKCVHFGTLPNRRPSMTRPRRATEITEGPILRRI